MHYVVCYHECYHSTVEIVCYLKGQHKIEFIPDIVGPILQMTLIPENGKKYHKLSAVVCNYT